MGHRKTLQDQSLQINRTPVYRPSELKSAFLYLQIHSVSISTYNSNGLFTIITHGPFFVGAWVTLQKTLQDQPLASPSTRDRISICSLV